MADDPQRAAMHEYYELGAEDERLVRSARGRLEFERTQEIVQRYLPRPPAAIADVGGGPGRYALWLASLGYRVVHRDIVPMHVEQVREAAAVCGGGAAIDTAVADARDLDLKSGSVDAVLLLGPLYHLSERAERVRALREAARIVRPGGPVFAAAISRWAPRLDGILRCRVYENYADAELLIGEAERTGVLPPLGPGSFCGFAHRPGQLRGEFASAGLAVTDLVCVEGGAFLLDDLDLRLADERDWRVVLETARALERVPELLGIGPHLLATAHR